MGARGRRLSAAAVAVALASASTADAAPARDAARPTVVVAVADTGVNPYHDVFYRPANTEHPCTWVLGFTDCSIPALELSVGVHRDVEAAFEADREVWASVEPHRWYWIPRTNIIGAVCDTVVGGGATDAVLPPDGPVACILDEHGHGTGTASSVLSEAPDALLLVHEGNAGGNDMVTSPVTPDLQSHSWGPAAPLPLQATRPVFDDPCPVAEAGPETLVFLAAGNEAPLPTPLDCARSRPEVQVVGGAYPGYWLASSWSLYDFASWYCRPTASSTTVTEHRTYCGTSFSAPTAAGAAAAALLRVRQHDRYPGRSTPSKVSPSVTREAFVEALRTAATYTPRSRFPERVPCHDPTRPCFGSRSVSAVPLPPQAPHLFWGYGWLDATVTDAVVACALRRTCPAKAPEAAAYNAQRQQARAALALMPLTPPPGDDAGSGRDAGLDARTAVPVVPGVTYAGRLERNRDWEDAYVLRARAGQQLSITAAASPEPAALAGCWHVLGPDGDYLTETSLGNIAECDPGTPPASGLRLPADGRYTVLYESFVPQDYRFSVTLAR